MADSCQRSKNRYNRRKYKQVIWRVPRGSELEACVTEQVRNGCSVNFLITSLLAEYYDVKIPQTKYVSTTTVPIE